MIRRAQNSLVVPFHHWCSAGTVDVCMVFLTPCSDIVLLLVCRAATWLPKSLSWTSSLDLMPPEKNRRKAHAPAFSVECPSMSMDTQVKHHAVVHAITWRTSRVWLSSLTLFFPTVFQFIELNG